MNIIDSTYAPQAGKKTNTSCGILHAYLCGPNVQQLKKENDIISAVRLQMEAVYPELKGKFTGHGVVKFWDDDEWAQGAFAIFKKGEMTALLPHIARPERRVYFAGDHASTRPGWVEGALESGHRVAEEIMQQASSGAAKPT
jgi:monoamine oxidase